MNKEILMVVDVVSHEKGVDKSVIFEAIEAALASATRKKYGGDIDIRVSIDRHTGEYQSYQCWLVIDDEAPDFNSPERQRLLSYARRDNVDIQVGEYIEEPIEAADFGRIAAQVAKQVIVQKVREAERRQVVEAYEDRVGDLIMGVVKRSERHGVYMDLGGAAEAFIRREDMIPRENVRPGERLRGYLKEVRHEPRGPQLFISRTVSEFLIELFKLEVPEVGQGVIEIKAAARDPGQRAKIAVYSHDPRLDPVGACVGMRGSRVQSVSNELAGERIDIVLWNENPAQFVINAMSPAEVVSIVVDEDRHSMDVAVVEDKLSQAIGRGGQNIKLASQLTGWELNVMSERQAEEKTEVEARELMELFMSQLDVDEEVATILVQEGFSSIEEVAYVPISELLEIEEFDKEIVEELRARSRDVLLTHAIAAEENQTQPAEDLLALEGMDDSLVRALVQRGIVTAEGLAEQSLDDLFDIPGLKKEQAAKLIMAARAPWFE